MLKEFGCNKIGFDHFVKAENLLSVAVREGRLRVNFQGYTDDQARTIVDFGASAISFINGLYAQNHKDIGKYKTTVATCSLPILKGVVQTARDKMYAAAISDLMCRFEADLSRVVENASQLETDRILSLLNQFESDGVIV